MRSPDVDIVHVAVNYHSCRWAVGLARQVSELEGPIRVQHVIVDNSDGDEDYEALSAATCDMPNVSVQRSAENLGYFGAANRALERLYSTESLPDWIIVSNVDVALQNGDFYAHLRRRFDATRTQCIAPRIMSRLSLTDQNPHMRNRPSRLRMWFYVYLFGSTIASAIYQSMALAKVGLKKTFGARGDAGPEPGTETEPERIYAGHGSFLIFGKSFFEQGGNLNFPPFLFGEEVFVAEQIREMNGTVLYAPDLAVVHEEHVSTGILKTSRLLSYQREAYRYLFDRFFVAKRDS